MDSNLTPKVNFLLLEGIDKYFKERTIEVSDNLPHLVKKLYAIGDGNLYTIISICNHDGYQAVLLPPLTQFIRHSAKEAINFLKESREYNNESLGKPIREINTLMKVALEILRDSTRSSRKAIGDIPAGEVEYPDYETLKSFYECGRKVKYDSLEEAESKLAESNNVYLCDRCSHYHQGRPIAHKAPVVPEEIKLGRYKTVWRRYHKI